MVTVLVTGGLGFIGLHTVYFLLVKGYRVLILDSLCLSNKEDIKKLQTLAKNENLKLITTEKDFFRLKQLGFKKIDYIIVDLIISEYKKFEKEILKYL